MKRNILYFFGLLVLTFATSCKKENEGSGLKAVFSYVADGYKVNFTNFSSKATEYTWDFGDGTQQTFTSPPFSHAYSQTGNYGVSLLVKNSANCSDKFSISNTVLITNPVAGFRADTLY